MGERSRQGLPSNHRPGANKGPSGHFTRCSLSEQWAASHWGSTQVGYTWGGGVVKELGKGRCEGSDQDKLREGRGLFPLASLVTAHQPREVRAGTQPGKQEGKQEPQTSSSAGLPPRPGFSGNPGPPPQGRHSAPHTKSLFTKMPHRQACPWSIVSVEVPHRGSHDSSVRQIDHNK